MDSAKFENVVMNHVKDQPDPKNTTGRAMWPVVISEVNAILCRADDVKQVETFKTDMMERHNCGVKRYGVALEAFNGRNPLVDTYQEILDAVVYARQQVEEYEYKFTSDTSPDKHYNYEFIDLYCDLVKMAFRCRTFLDK